MTTKLGKLLFQQEAVEANLTVQNLEESVETMLEDFINSVSLYAPKLKFFSAKNEVNTLNVDKLAKLVAETDWFPLHSAVIETKSNLPKEIDAIKNYEPENKEAHMAAGIQSVSGDYLFTHLSIVKRTEDGDFSLHAKLYKLVDFKTYFRYALKDRRDVSFNVLNDNLNISKVLETFFTNVIKAS
jgi:hypothetical protein